MSPPTEADEKGNEALKSPLPRPTGRNANAGGGADADVERYAAPDADADRDAPVAPADQGEEKIKKPPLEIKQIEDIKDDAMGG
jgi:hypothetical protein